MSDPTNLEGRPERGGVTTTTIVDGPGAFRAVPWVTVDQLRREIETSLAVVKVEFHGVTTRLDGMDKATEVFQDNLTRVPTEIDRRLKGERELTDQAFANLDTRIRVDKDWAEKLVEKGMANAKELSALGMSNAKEAVTKAEQANEGQKVIQRAEYNAQMGAITQRVSMNDSRLDKLEGASTNRKDERTAIGTNIGLVIGFASLLSALVGVYFGHLAQPSAPAAPVVGLVPPATLNVR